MQDNLTLVSIGLPIYNRPEGLIRAMDSLINQTYQNFEIIIADNCSPNPEVEKIAREYLEKDSRVRYYRHESNKGWGFNTNFVIEKSKGDYFMRATDDDWWDASFVEKIMGLMLMDKSASLGFCNYIAVDENGQKGEKYPAFLPLLQEFTSQNKIQNIKNYINQFEGFGKSNLYFSIYKIEYLRSDFVYQALKDEVLAGDLQINLYCLLRGNFCLHPDELFKVTFGNVKLYEQTKTESKKVDLLFLTFDYKIFKSLNKNWKHYFTSLYSIVNDSEISLLDKIRIYPTISKRIILFWYDCICVSTRVRVYNVFEKMKRKHILE